MNVVTAEKSLSLPVKQVILTLEWFQMNWLLGAALYPGSPCSLIYIKVPRQIIPMIANGNLSN